MTPERRRDFEHQWPEIQSGLKSLLSRKKVPALEHDDLIQETALRLYGMWGRVDPSRSPWPLAVTIALNLVRDGARHRPIKEVASAEIPDRPDLHEVERAGLARVELGRVRAALGELSPSYRSALLVEVGDATARAASGSAAQKMTRVRARRKLVQLVEKVSALLPLRHLKFWRSNWFTELGQWVVGAREGLLGSIPCIACIAVGVTTVMATNVVAPAPADALPRPAGVSSVAEGPFGASPRLLRSEVAKGDAARRAAATTTARRGGTKLAKASSGEHGDSTSAPSSTPTLPTPPEVPSGDEELPIENPVPGNGDKNLLDHAREVATETVATVTSALPGI
ncbi:MAG TPA: sigma-70 family RNA polymerase sigma factor [Actinomycetota bacterium]|jgi:DNA-directed RNA polymerase specialized sigma24 family protein